MRLKKSTLGRQKIPMVKIKNKSSLAVTFSKRRVGLLNKASELSTICGAEIAIIGFTPAKKAFSFGHLDVESVVNRFLFGNIMPLPPGEQLDAYCKKLHNLNMELTQALSGLEDEKKKKDRAMEQMGKENVRMSMIKGWEKPIEEMNMSETEEMKHVLEELANKHRAHSAYLSVLGQQRNNSLHAYGYAQASQGYQQDGYGAYNVSQQSGYGQAAIGYDQQVGHDSTTNPSQEDDTFKATLASLAQFGLVSYGTSSQHLPVQGSTSQIGYGFDPSSQVGNRSQPPIAYSSWYAPPPASNSQAYGQSQQLQGAPGSYGNQSGYAELAASLYGSVYGNGQAPQAYWSYGGYTQPDAGGGTPGL